MQGGELAMDQHPIQGVGKLPLSPSHFMLKKPKFWHQWITWERKPVPGGGGGGGGGGRPYIEKIGGAYCTF